MTTAVMGNPNVYSPYGMQTVSYDPTGPDGMMKPTVTQTLNPQSQAIFDQQQQMRQKLAGLGTAATETAGNVLGSGFDTSNLPTAPINPGTTAQNAMMSRLEPTLDRRRQALHTQLLNEGHVRGNAGYDNAMEDYGRTENDLLLQAGAAGIPMDQQARQQALAEQMTLRNLPINEIAALMSGSQIQNPQFGGYSGAPVAAPNFQQIAGQQGQWDQGLYNAGVGRANAANSNMTSLGAAAITAFSDRRLKTNITRIGTHPLGIGWYEFDYLWGEHAQGVMADELQPVMPEAVVMHPSGYAMVNYALIGRV